MPTSDENLTRPCQRTEGRAPPGHPRSGSAGRRKDEGRDEAFDDQCPSPLRSTGKRLRDDQPNHFASISCEVLSRGYVLPNVVKSSVQNGDSSGFVVRMV